jgi:hypothetical protein
MEEGTVCMLWSAGSATNSVFLQIYFVNVFYSQIYQTAKYLVNCAYSPAYVQYFVKMFGENNQEKPVRVMCLDMANEMVSLRCGNLVRSGSRLTNAIAEKYLYSNFHTIEQGFQHEIGNYVYYV